jgi:PKD repeat protein
MNSKGRGRRGPLLAVALCAAMLGLAAGATGADAIVAKIGGHGYGVTPIRGVNPHSIQGAYRSPLPTPLSRAGARRYDELPFGGRALTYHGGPVMHANRTHVIYWDPGHEFTETTTGIINGFFTKVAHDSGLASSVFGIAGQYTDTTGNASYSSAFGGPKLDSTSYEASGCIIPVGLNIDKGPPYTECLSEGQLTKELSAYITKEGLPTGPTELYFLLLPHKVVTCFPERVVEGEIVRECSNNVFCAYHSSIGAGSPSEIIYATIPFTLLDKENAKGCQSDGLAGSQIQTPNGDTAGTEESTRFADVALKYISHEYIEATTDPLVNENGKIAWLDAFGQEIGDKCNGVPYTEEEEGEPGFDKNAFAPTLGGAAIENNLFNQSINEGHYYLQSEWDNGGKACLMRPVSLGGTINAASQAAGSPTAFTASTTDPYGTPAYTWSFGDGGTATGSSPSHTYAAPGSYTVTMTMTEPLTGSTGSAQRTLLVNDLPSASFTLAPNPSTAGAPVALNAGASTDPDGSIASYAWSFGDGSTASGATASHVYGAPGTYTVTLTVTDSAGLGATATQTVTVNPPPNSDFSIIAMKVNAKTGVITFTGAVSDPGSFSWLLTFQNGKFGVFTAGTSRCKAGLVRLKGRCRPSKIVYGKGGLIVGAPGTVTFTIRPSSSALKALRNALKQRKGVPVAAAFTFQSARGGGPVSHAKSSMVKLKKR